MKFELTIDSSVYLSAIEQNDNFFEESANFFRTILQEDYQITSPILIVCEIIHTLKRNTKNPQILESRLRLIKKSFTKSESRVIAMEKNFLRDFEKLSPLFSKLKTSDAIVALTALIYNTTLISWDKKLNEVSRKHISVYTPSEFLRKNKFRRKLEID